MVMIRRVGQRGGGSLGCGLVDEPTALELEDSCARVTTDAIATTRMRTACSRGPLGSRAPILREV